MIDFNYTAPELLPLRIQEVLEAPNEPHRIGGVVYEPEGGGDSSIYSELFGTPERAARVIVALNNCRVVGCVDCAARGACRYDGCGDDYDALLEWLKGDA